MCVPNLLLEVFLLSPRLYDGDVRIFSLLDGISTELSFSDISPLWFKQHKSHKKVKAAI